jgi:hypothetical protein
MDTSKKGKKMKRSMKVTEANLATILGYVKNVVRSKRFFYFTEVRANTLKQATRRVNCKLAIFCSFGLSNKAVIVKKETHPNAFPKPFISVQTHGGSVAIIDIEDQISVTANAITIKKGAYGENREAIEVWKFK